MKLSALLSSVVIAGVAQPSASSMFANPPGYKKIPKTQELDNKMYEALRNDANYRLGGERICMTEVTEYGTTREGHDHYFHGTGCALSSASPDGRCPKDCKKGHLVVNVRKDSAKTQIYATHSHLLEVYQMPNDRPGSGSKAAPTGSGSKSSGESSTAGSGNRAPVPPTAGSSSKAAPPTAGSSSKAAPPTAGSSSKAAPPTAGSSSKAAPPTAGSSSKAAPAPGTTAPAPGTTAPAPGTTAPARGTTAPAPGPAGNAGNAFANIPGFHSAGKELLDIWKTIDMPNGLQQTIGDVFQFHGKTFCVDSISNVQYQTFSDPQQYLRAIREGLYRVNVNGCFSSSITHCGCKPMAYTGTFNHVRGSHSYVISNIVKTGDKPAYCP